VAKLKLGGLEIEAQPLVEKQDKSNFEHLQDAVSNQAYKLLEQDERLKTLEAKVISKKNIVSTDTDILKQCEAMIERVRMNKQLDINGLKAQNKRQYQINLVLSCVLILTLFLHLL